MKKLYIDHTFRPRTLAVIDQANEIIEEYQEEGYDLTLRQLYYQFVARDLIPNTDREYSKLGGIISKARLAGLIDWDAIKDRTRTPHINNHWSGPDDIIRWAADDYGIDTRATQKTYLEVWVEKDALIGVLERACVSLDVRYFSCRGYVSQSAMWAASLRFIRQEQRGRKTVLLHLGDHDPSGIDMTRDIQDRLNVFGSDVIVERIALTMEQIDEYNPPPNPAKTTDSRYENYIGNFGEESWELDALEPQVITQLITDAAAIHTNKTARQKLVTKQENDRDVLNEAADNWEEIIAMLDEKNR